MKESIENRIGRYLGKAMTETERADFERDVQQDPHLADTVSMYRKIWDQPIETASASWDTNAAWKTFANKHEISVPVQSTRRLFLRIAAAASILLIGGISFVLFSGPSAVTYFYADYQETPVELRDGTTVFLNKGSSITVHPFNRKARHVELSGEAFFDVAHNPKAPFTITCAGTTTEVVGTSFTLRQSEENVYLHVHSGKVIFSETHQPDHAVALMAGEATDYKNGQFVSVPNPSPNANAWQTRQLQFKGMPLSEVIRDLESYFNTTIVVENDNILKCPITITRPFKNPEVNRILKAIALSLSAEVESEGNKFILRGGSCS